jgi:hypothetical protein
MPSELIVRELLTTGSYQVGPFGNAEVDVGDVLIPGSYPIGFGAVAAVDPSFALKLRAAIIADPVASKRGARIVAVIDSQDSPSRTRQLARFEHAVRVKAAEAGHDLVGSIDWQTVFMWLGAIEGVVEMLLLLLPFLSPSPTVADPVSELRTAVIAFAWAGKLIIPNYCTNGVMDTAQLEQLLSDMGVGNILDRGIWADEILAKVNPRGSTIDVAQVQAAAAQQ